MDNALTKEEAELLYGMVGGAVEQFEETSMNADDRRQCNALVARLQIIQIKLAAVVNANG